MKQDILQRQLFNWFNWQNKRHQQINLKELKNGNKPVLMLLFQRVRLQRLLKFSKQIREKEADFWERHSKRLTTQQTIFWQCLLWNWTKSCNNNFLLFLLFFLFCENCQNRWERGEISFLWFCYFFLFEFIYINNVVLSCIFCFQNFCFNFCFNFNFCWQQFNFKMQVEKVDDNLP